MWILIVITLATYQPSVVSNVAFTTFGDRDMCQSAGELVKQNTTNVRWFCMPYTRG